MLVVILFLVTILLAYWAWCLQWVRTWTVDRKVPLISGATPFFGHAIKIIGNAEELWEMGKIWSRETNELGGLAKAWMGPMPYYFVTDPEMSLKLSNACLQKHYIYRFASSWIGDGLITAHEPIWRRHRKLLNPTFNQHVLNGFLDIFNMQAELLTDRLEAHAGQGKFDHWPLLADNALETVCKTVFGLNCRDEEVIDNDYKAAVARVFSLLINRFMKFWLHPDPVYSLTSSKKEEDVAVGVLKRMSSNVIEQKKLVFDNKSFENSDSGLRFKTFLDMLMELGSQGLLTDTEIREEVDGMIVAAHDTSSASVMYTLMVLGSFPEVQQKVYDEIIKVLGTGDKAVTKENLMDLVYMEAVIKESLRVYPVGPLLARTANEDVHIDDYIIPRGASIIISVWGTHRHEVWGADADEFRPERWFEDTLPEHPGAFAAFSLGRRGCIGKAYALMAMKTILCHVLRRYKITADHTKLRAKLDVLFKPISGHEISIEKRA